MLYILIRLEQDGMGQRHPNSLYPISGPYMYNWGEPERSPHIRVVQRVRLYIYIYVIYKSWLRGVFRVYTTRESRSEDVCSAYAPSRRRGAYALQTSSGRDLRVVYMRNTPSNHDLYNIYASRRRHKLETGTKDGKTWRILYIKIAGT